MPTGILQPYYNPSMRGYPDVSALGHGYLVVLANTLAVVDGSSASAPVFAGLIGLVNRLRQVCPALVVGPSTRESWPL